MITFLNKQIDGHRNSRNNHAKTAISPIKIAKTQDDPFVGSIYDLSFNLPTILGPLKQKQDN